MPAESNGEILAQLTTLAQYIAGLSTSMQEMQQRMMQIETKAYAQDTMQIMDAQQQQRLQSMQTAYAQVPAPRAQQQQMQNPYAQISDVWYVRIKPFDESLGHLRRTQTFHELGNRTLKGGTGGLRDIPQWVEINADQAWSMSKYRQDDSNPRSEPVCDIVTYAEMEQINEVENNYRMALMGYGMPPQATLPQMNSVRAGVTVMGQQTAMQGGIAPPSVITGAQLPSTAGPVPGQMQPQLIQQYQYQPQAQQAPQMQQTLPAGMPARAQALQGLGQMQQPPPAPVQAAPIQRPFVPAPPPMPRAPQATTSRGGIDEDMTREATQSAEIAKLSAETEALPPPPASTRVSRK